MDYVESNPLISFWKYAEVSQLGSSRNSEVHVSCTHVAMCVPFYAFFGFQTVDTCELPPKSHCMHCILQLLVSNAAHCSTPCAKTPVWWPTFFPVAGQVMYIVPLMWLRTIMEYQYKTHGLSVVCATVGRVEVDWKRSQDSV